MFSLCITNYERTDMLLESFEHVLHDPRIREIVISDDCSSEEVFEQVKGYAELHGKIKVFRNDQNVGMSLNKKIAIERATSDYCILFDSDNILKKNYLDALMEYRRYPNVILAPDSGGGVLNYKKFSGWYVCQDNIRHFLSQPGSGMLLNTCNYMVHRQQYLDTYQFDPEVQGADTIWFNYLWLKRGGAFLVVPRMSYYHRVHEGSGYMKDLEANNRMCFAITKLMKDVKS